MTEHLSDPEGSLKARVRREFWLGFWGYILVNILFSGFKISQFVGSLVIMVVWLLLLVFRPPVAAGMTVVMTTWCIFLMWLAALGFAFTLPIFVFEINPILCVFPGLLIGVLAVCALACQCLVVARCVQWQANRGNIEN